MKKYLPSIKYLATSLTAMASGLVIAAQQPPRLEEVEVTARRIAEGLQQAPVSVTAIGGDLIDSNRIASVTDVESVTPNLNFTLGQGGGSSTVNAFIRGVGEIDFIITSDPAVGLYLDGVYMARAFGVNMELTDIERVEVIRGPQGLLFGKNSIGGAINVVTKKPEGKNTFDIEATTGRFDFYGSKFYGDVGITDTLTASLSLLYQNSDGWQKRPGRDAGAVNVRSGRGIVRWMPTDNFESQLTIDAINQNNNGYPNVMVAYAPGAPFDVGNAVNADIDRSNGGGVLPNDKLEGTGYGWTNTLQLDSVTIKSITAYREMEALFGRDGDQRQAEINGDVHDEDHEQYSQEFQFSGEALDGRLDWLAGLYYFEENSRDNTDLIIFPGAFLSPNYDNEQDTESSAIYLHGSFNLTDALAIIGGLRNTWEEKTFNQTITNIDLGLPWAIPAPPPGIGPGLATAAPECSEINSTTTSFTCNEDWEELSWKLGLEFQATDDLMVYGHYSTGFRSGGFNGRPFGSVNDIAAYQPETLDSVELGFKSELFDNRLRLNMAFFHNTYEDVQLLTVRAGAVAIENATEATIQGFELEATAVPVSGLTVFAGVGYLDDDSDGWIDVTGDFTNTELAHTPEWSLNSGISYDWDLNQAGSVRTGADIKYKSSHFVDAQNTAVLEAPGHSIINAVLAYTTANEQWEVALHGKNLSDKRVINSGSDVRSFFGYVEGSYTEPRRWYLTLKYSHD